MNALMGMKLQAQKATKLNLKKYLINSNKAHSYSRISIIIYI